MLWGTNDETLKEAHDSTCKESWLCSVTAAGTKSLGEKGKFGGEPVVLSLLSFARVRCRETFAVKFYLPRVEGAPDWEARRFG